MRCCRQVRRPHQAVPVQFKVGDVIRHRRYHYRGVIYGWDPECKAEEDWMQQMRIDQLPGMLVPPNPGRCQVGSCPLGADVKGTGSIILAAGRLLVTGSVQQCRSSRGGVTSWAQC